MGGEMEQTYRLVSQVHITHIWHKYLGPMVSLCGLFPCWLDLYESWKDILCRTISVGIIPYLYSIYRIEGGGAKRLVQGRGEEGMITCFSPLLR